MAKKMSDQVSFADWAQQQLAEKHHSGISLGDLLGSFGHTMAHPFSSGVHGLPGYGTLIGLLGTVLSGGAAAPVEAGAEAGAGAGAEEATAGAGSKAAQALKGAGDKVGQSRLAKTVAAHPIRSAMVPAGLGLLGMSAANSIKHKQQQQQVNPGQNAQGTTANTTNPTAAGSGIMPLFMQSVMQPYLNSIQNQISQTSQNYGDYMNQMLGGNSGIQLNPAVKQALQAMVPGQQSMMNLMGLAGQQQAVGGAALDQISQQIQQAQQAQQSAAGMYEKYMVPMMYGGSVSPIGQMPAGAGAASPGGGTAPQTSMVNPLGSMQQNLMQNQIARAGG